MKNLLTTLCLTIVVLLGSSGCETTAIVLLDELSPIGQIGDLVESAGRKIRYGLINLKKDQGYSSLVYKQQKQWRQRKKEQENSYQIYKQQQIVSSQKISDKNTCRNALDHNTLKWSVKEWTARYKKEANRRGLTLNDCLKLLDLVSPEKPSSITKTSQPKQDGNLKERLRKLKEIYDEGIIEKEDYKKKLDELMKQL